MDIIKIYNAKVITPYKMINNGTIIVENGKIAFVGSENIQTVDCCEINANGNYVSPGFIDIHLHGGGGHDFMDGSVKAFTEAAESHARHGTTSMVPTTHTSSNEVLKETLGLFKQARMNNPNGAELLGLHLEGPYIAMSQKGAQHAKYIKNPEPEDYKEILSWSDDIIR